MIPRYLQNPSGYVTFEDLRKIVSTPSPFKRQSGAVKNDLYFDVAMAVADAGFRGAREYLYHSPLRPLSDWVARNVSSTLVLSHWLASYGPISSDDVVRYELEPVGRALARFAIDGSAQLGIPLELSTDEMTLETTRAAVLFRNPRGVWQLSYFDRLGPVGHQEHDPEEMVLDAIRAGYRWVSPGVVDVITDIGPP